MQRSCGIGGQAVLEGIMMRSGEKYAISVRKADHEIETDVRDVKRYLAFKGSEKIPILRGVCSFVDSMIVGMSTLMWSAQFFEEEEDCEKRKTMTEEEKAKEEKSWGVMMTVTLIISLVLAVGVFMVLPYFLASLLGRIGVSDVLINVAEALLRIVIFLGYMFLISRMKDIQRVFAYHGAEHKCINCIEHGLPLTTENVLKSSRLHKRCGTSFLLIVIVITVICFLILGACGITSHLMRIVLRLILVPVIAGVAYEFLRLGGKSDNALVDLLTKPGLALQKLVTREPDEEMAEVAITAIESVFDWKKWQEENC
ncbi:MAG: DUF1385 domain-containing protein [Lachnospiraceae bacterium]|nr:DUF1385 domain-containing protein [Lachnospiraceae bacterium]